MQIYRMLLLIALGTCASMLAACASEPPPALPTPTVPPRMVLMPVGAVLAEPQRWSGQRITVVSPVLLTGDDRVLTSMLLDTTRSTAGQTGQAIWLEQPVDDTIRSRLSDGAGVLKIRGKLSPPGAYGRDQRFAYQITAEEIDVLQPERTTLINLTQNPHTLDRILLRVQGILLSQQDSALLVDQVSEGGVPTGAHQIKLPSAAFDQSLLNQLNSSGSVRWGAVEVLGWWQDGTLTPFKITPAEEAR